MKNVLLQQAKLTMNIIPGGGDTDKTGGGNTGGGGTGSGDGDGGKLK
ncbi:hypothetical protein [uncultured Tenacibaculum sp.]|nr:hypothetical protein [uncultured Tenacibaculum sp.]